MSNSFEFISVQYYNSNACTVFLVRGVLTLWYFVLALVLAIIAYSVYTWYAQKRIVKTLTQEEFIAGYRKAQLIDVREQTEYEAGHILGARNIPMTQLSQRHKEIRPDLPVYLYCQNTGRSARAALMLKKKGYHQIYQLQGGFKTWTGKVKAKA